MRVIAAASGSAGDPHSVVAMSSLLLAFLAGVVTIAAPCTLPVLPILLGASIGRAATMRPIFIVLGFVLTFTAVALLLGAVTEALDFDPNVLRNGAALMLIVFGVLMVWPSLLERFSTPIRNLMPTFAGANANRSGNLGGFMLGATLGLVWTPCAGPVLGSILTLVAISKDLSSAGLQLVAYAVGAALPMLAIAYGGQALTTRTRKLACYAPRLQQGFGAVVIAFAVVTYLHYDTLVIAWLTRFYPEAFSTL